MVRYIYKVTNGTKWRITVLCMLQGGLAVSGVIFALLMKHAVDGAVSGNSRKFAGMALLMLCVLAAQIIMHTCSRRIDASARAVIGNRLRRSVFRSALEADYVKVTEYHSAEVMNRITSDTGVVTDGIVAMIPGMVSMAVRIIGVLIVLWSMEPWFCLLFLAGGVVMAGLSFLPRKWLKKLSLAVQKEDDNVRSFLQECIESMLIIRTFGCGKKMEKEGAARMEGHRKAQMRKSDAANVCSTGLNLIVQGGYAVGFIWGGIGILNGTVTYGSLVAVLQLIGQIQSPFVTIGSLFPRFSAVSASVERMMELSGKKTENTSEPGEISELYDRISEIVFDNVSFQYNSGTKVLQHESFSVGKDEFAAITGESGVGKSTLLKLLMAVYSPQEGRIFFRCMDSSEVRTSPEFIRMFAYVPQNNYLMSGTINEVVAFSEQSETIDRQRVEAACQIACAYEFIDCLPDRFDTQLGEHGAGLSEGQMQRLAIARAIYSGCPVLLLDESTSALDPETEKKLMRSLRRLEGRTVFLVTHRKDAWEMCDREIRI